jgi:uncharacterized membrane protein (DUF485 family)
MSNCGNPCCEKARLKSCSGCLKEMYCDTDCQKADWKTHKQLCLIMKNDDKLLEYSEISIIMNKLMNLASFSRIKNNIKLNKENKNRSAKILTYCVLFVKKQFGEKIIGSSYRKSRLNTRVSNHSVDFGILMPIYDLLCTLYIPVENMSHYIYNSECVDDSYKALKHLDDMVSILNYWDSERNLNKKDQYEVYNRSYSLTIHYFNAHCRYGMCKQYQKNYRSALIHYDISIHCVKKNLMTNENLENLRKCLTIEGKIKYKEARNIYEEGIDKLCTSLMLKAYCLFGLSKFEMSNVIFEEIYIIMSEAYSPDHPKVLDKVGFIIENLIEMKEYVDAEKYARVSYECLFRSDSKSVHLSIIADQLALVTFELIKQNVESTNKSINIKNLLTIEEVGMLLVNALTIKIEYNSSNIDPCCYNDEMQHIKDRLCDIYTFMGKNNTEILDLFANYNISYSITDDNDN